MANAAFPGANGKIAFDSNRDGNWEIYTMNVDGSGVTRITHNQALDADPAWSPDGSKIAFYSNRDGNFEIYAMNADGTAQTRITDSPASDYGPAWSPDGTKIVFFSDRPAEGYYEIYTMNADGSGVTNVTNNPDARDIQPAWSPDGTKIAFSSDRVNPGSGSYDLYTTNADGSGVTDLTNDPQWIEGGANWSPDGTKISFHTDRGGAGFDIYTMNPDGTGQNRITDVAAFDQDPAWSPDGTKIAFDRREFAAYFQVYAMNADGTGVVDLTGNRNTEIYPSHPDWQPLHFTGYARPKGATPFRASLVVAYRKCTAPNEQHGPSLAFGSCAPPVQESNWLTTGTSDTDGQATQFVGSLRLDTVVGDPATPADEADVATAMTITDVRNKTDTTDYAGGVQANAVLRMTDHYNSAALGGGADVATVVDIPFPVDATCAATADPAIGSTCSVSSSFEAIVPGAVKEQRRAIWQLGAIDVYDGGSDGNPGTLPNTVFARQGLFVP